MKKIILLLMIGLSYSGAFAQSPAKEIPADYAYIVKVGQQIPDFSMITTDGKTVQTADLKGKVVMLQFTASWCGVCRKEMPHIEADIWRKYKDNPNFALFGIDLDEPVEKVKTFAKQIPVTYPLALDPKGGIFYQFAEKGAGVTRNVIVDKTGKIVFMTRLYKEEEFQEMKKVIAELLK
ncbi:AhpC/TSA family protein [Aquipluma nitroreducens]|uniref:AhpC/TSA family protein n=1 Tax=Aquipluma nitroreducens TaxID=2010828 RepID=A0A5K7S698_9BACT|nr:TlpA disulfide reductase family protein [Aquipluma nitroreducens]BBE17063.1 AhpC/TSA family protein [Aquipluma nitroreducens]